MEIEPRQGIYLFCVGLEATQTNADFIPIHISLQHISTFESLKML